MATELAKAKWKVWAVYLPMAILFSPIIVVVFGIVSFFQVWNDIRDEEYRWGKYVDDFEAKKNGPPPHPGWVWDERCGVWQDPAEAS